MVGSRLEAIDHFTIPKSIRSDLKVKVGSGYTDGTVAITKYGVYSEQYQFNNLMLMHFGKNKMCWGADRSRWSDTHVEYGDLYCSGTYCITIPHVCGNVTQLYGRTPWQGVPDLSPPSPGPSLSPEVHTVPEPGTLSLTLLALILWRVKSWRRSKTH